MMRETVMFSMKAKRILAAIFAAFVLAAFTGCFENKDSAGQNQPNKTDQQKKDSC